MTSFEAVQVLVARARRVAQWGWAVGTLVMVAVCLVSLAVYLLGFEEHTKLLAATFVCTTLCLNALVLGSVQFAVRQVLKMRRPTWAEALAREEGLDARRLLESFTLDAW